MSVILSKGLEGVSIQISRVFARRAARTASGCDVSTELCEMFQRWNSSRSCVRVPW
jgi:hypothetical protein